MLRLNTSLKDIKIPKTVFSGKKRAKNQRHSETAPDASIERTKMDRQDSLQAAMARAESRRVPGVPGRASR